MYVVPVGLVWCNYKSCGQLSKLQEVWCTQVFIMSFDLLKIAKHKSYESKTIAINKHTVYTISASEY